MPPLSSSNLWAFCVYVRLASARTVGQILFILGMDVLTEVNLYTFSMGIPGLQTEDLQSCRRNVSGRVSPKIT
jgi:hypothetical protein